MPFINMEVNTVITIKTFVFGLFFAIAILTLTILIINSFFLTSRKSTKTKIIITALLTAKGCTKCFKICFSLYVLLWMIISCYHAESNTFYIPTNISISTLAVGILAIYEIFDSVCDLISYLPGLK